LPLAVILAGLVLIGKPLNGQTQTVGAGQTTSHNVTYDSHSLIVDGKRVFLYSGEIHPYRLPSPSLWLDVLQKIKAAGFTGISCYFDWGYHSAAPGLYDFTGIRNLDQFLDLANQVGLYVTVRPGPYINAEVDGGGFPPWLNEVGGNVRSTDPRFLQWADQWMSQIDAIVARHQLTNGTGSVIAYQIENELFDPSASGLQYMQDLENKARADGITVPLTFNESTVGATLYITGLGAVQIPGFDSYPNGFNPSAPTVWGQVTNYDADQSLLQNSPLYAPEFGGGTTDEWGGPGYQNCFELTKCQLRERLFQIDNRTGAHHDEFLHGVWWHELGLAALLRQS
jgi:beta-galactosidase GanA